MSAADLLDFRPEAPITEAGLRKNINVGIHYLGAWLGRQRLRADPQPDGRRGHRRDQPQPGLAVDPLAQGRARRRPQGHRRAGARARSRRSWRRSRPAASIGKFDRAAEIFEQMSTQDEFAEFLTLPLYEEI